MATCRWCGGHVETSTETMCDDCKQTNKEYNKLKRKMRKCPDNQTSERLQQLIDYYKRKKRYGYQVPIDI